MWFCNYFEIEKMGPYTAWSNKVGVNNGGSHKQCTKN